MISRTGRLTQEFAGLLVTTLQTLREGDFGMTLTQSKLQPYWVVSFMAGRRPAYPRGNFPATLGIWPDAWLRPIRDDGSLFDETMFWTVRKNRA